MLSLKAYFVTGTDTGVGKTTITAGLAGCIRNLGINVGIMKPIATGLAEKKGYKSKDVAILSEAAGTNEPEDLVNPVFLPALASPYDASKLLNMPIDMPLIFTKFKKLISTHDVVLVEGIGGIMTPITKKFFVVDMIKAMAVEVIIVTRASLGTLNHTVMTCKMCKDNDIKIKGLIINNFDEKGTMAEKNTPTTIYELTGINILGTIPFIKNFNDINMMIKTIERNIDIQSLIS